MIDISNQCQSILKGKNLQYKTIFFTINFLHSHWYDTLALLHLIWFFPASTSAWMLHHWGIVSVSQSMTTLLLTSSIVTMGPRIYLWISIPLQMKTNLPDNSWCQKLLQIQKEGLMKPKLQEQGRKTYSCDCECEWLSDQQP